jgi:integrase/recombinase XerD
MSKQASRSAGLTIADDLGGHLLRFLSTLTTAGYTQGTRDRKERLIAPFIQWVDRSRIPVPRIDVATIGTFIAATPLGRRDRRTSLGQFLAYLRTVGAVPTPCFQPSSAELTVARYVGHLRNRQGLSPHSIALYSRVARDFIMAKQLPEGAAALDPAAVIRYQLEHSRGRSASFAKLLAAALRSFLRFCFLDGSTAADLSTAVQPVRRWRLAAIPPFLTAEEIERVIAVAGADRCTARGCRAFAILLLLARLGLRASEVLALEIDHIRWSAGELLVRGKGRLQDRLPLPHDVGEALALYLRDARGRGPSRRVFLRHIAPHGALSQPSIVSKIAREALERAGLLPSGRVGAHIFRHSLATRMIQGGASLTEIAQVLRHRSTTTTELYAKVEIEGLRVVALPWPNAEVSQ